MTRRAAALLLLGSAFVLVLASTSTLAGAAAGRAFAASISAHLTETSLSSSRAVSVNLIYEFSEPSENFSYLLTFKKGSTWQTVKRLKRNGYFKGAHSMTVKKIFAGEPVAVGSYRLKLFADGGSKLLGFKVIDDTSDRTTDGGFAGNGLGTGQVVPPADWNGVGCRGWKTTSAAKFVCNYDVEAPFSLTGYSMGGMSTLSYVVQCKKTSAAPQRVVMYPRVWYRRSQSVGGSFKVYGVKATQDAAKHCDLAEGKDPVLAITLKMGNGVGKVVLNVRIDSAMAWAK
jgi:hypothetical protein